MAQVQQGLEGREAREVEDREEDREEEEVEDQEQDEVTADEAREDTEDEEGASQRDEDRRRSRSSHRSGERRHQSIGQRRAPPGEYGSLEREERWQGHQRQQQQAPQHPRQQEPPRMYGDDGAEVLVAVRGGELVSLSKTCQINVPVPVTMWRVDDEKLTNKQTRRRNTQMQTKTRYAKL